MSTYIKYSAAERESFKVVPETCPDVEAAMDVALRAPKFNEAFAAEIFGKHGLPAPDKKLREAIEEMVGRTLFLRKRELADVVLYKGTFPLRAALVHQIQMARGLPAERNHFSEWIADHEGMLQYRKPTNLEHAPG